jgi:hypothetical protein
MSEPNFATIGAVFEDGVSLIFDGSDAATEKHYKVNTSVLFSPGDRVKILADSGTYVVEYVVGSPSGSGGGGGLPAGGTAGQFLVKSSDEAGDAQWETAYTLPSGGSNGQVLMKNGSADGSVKWGVPSISSVSAVTNQYNSSASYNIFFRTTSTYGTPVFQIRMGQYGTWYTLTT